MVEQRIGYTCFLLATGMLALNNVLLKRMALQLDPYVIIAYRTLFSTMLLLPWLWLMKKPIVKPNKLNFIKSGMGLLWMPLWTLAICKLPISSVVALSFVTPLIITLLSVLLLQEKLHFLSIMGIIIGIVGALLVVKPVYIEFSYEVLLVLLVCLCWAGVAIITKKLTNSRQSAFFIVFYTNCLQALCTLPHILQTKVLPWWLYLEMAGLSVLCLSSSLLMAVAYKNSMVHKLMPLDYTRWLFSSLLAFYFFAEAPDFATICGSVLIFSAGLLGMMRK